MSPQPQQKALITAVPSPVLAEAEEELDAQPGAALTACGCQTPELDSVPAHRQEARPRGVTHAYPRSYSCW